MRIEIHARPPNVFNPQMIPTCGFAIAEFHDHPAIVMRLKSDLFVAITHQGPMYDFKFWDGLKNPRIMLSGESFTVHI